MSPKTSSKTTSSMPPSTSTSNSPSSSKLKSKTASSSSALTPSPSSSSIVALPSMSSHLFILPQAKRMDCLPVHPTSSAQRYAESEAKLKKALERNTAREDLTGVAAGASPMPAPPSLHPPLPPALQPSFPLVGQGHHLSGHHQQSYPPRTFIPQPVYSEPSSPISHSPPIMMRSRQKPTC